MVLNELGGRLSSALMKMARSKVIDDSVIEQLIDDIQLALEGADVNTELLKQMLIRLRASLDIDELPPAANRHTYIHKKVVTELVAMLDPKTTPYTLRRGRPNVVMLVGLQGAGKTTTAAKYAKYHKRRGWKVGMICCDTFRPGALDQLKQNCAAVHVPFYGSYTERDPAKLARDGVSHFKRLGFDLIIVDTSGRHRQEEALFEEMSLIDQAVSPNERIFVLDSTIGQAAMDQAAAFKQTVDIGSVIITKLDGHAKGGGALSAVAATQAPITFIGTGEGFDAFESFSSERFVGRLLGMGDTAGLLDAIKNADMDVEEQAETVGRMLSGEFRFRDFRTQLINIQKMGSLEKLVEMIPGMSQLMPKGALADGELPLRRWVYIMNSMTAQELDSMKVPELLSRQTRMARGSGTSLEEVKALYENAKQFAGMLSMFGKGGGMKGMDPSALQAMARKMGGGMPGGMPGMPGGMPGMPGGMDPAAAMRMAQQMMGGGGMKGMNVGKMMEMARSMGLGGGGMPGMGGGRGKRQKVTIRK
eukprot:gnl/Dysnectes_brevis/6973_a11286_458.p1 GENE.gnl/Dysnectes_brevis/6973_a11286_458~~gnl/Dysnectes_brevis/6973_a11286_458.p1  ORF type:complete len:544 (-),score=207.63 gnl/Dysnectes_brevis/6973_a11286_458:32-1627(-)